MTSLASVLSHLSECHRELGDLQAACKALRSGFVQYGRLSQRDASASASVSGKKYALSQHYKLAQELWDEDETGAALSVFRDGLTLGRQLVALEGRDRIGRNLVSRMAEFSGNILKSQKKWDAARVSYQESLEEARAYLRLDPARPDEVEKRIIILHEKLGEVYEKSGQIEEAIRNLRTGVQLSLARFEANVQDKATREILARLEGKLREILHHLGRFEEVCDISLTIVQCFQRVGNKLAENSQVQEPLATFYLRLGRELRKVGRYEEAIASFHQSLSIVKTLEPTGVEDDKYVLLQAVTYGELVRAAIRQSDKRRAAVLIDKCIKDLGHLRVTDTKVSWLPRLEEANALVLSVQMELKGEGLEEARPILERALSIVQSLRGPSKLPRQEVEVGFHLLMAAVEASRGNPKVAVEVLEALYSLLAEGVDPLPLAVFYALTYRACVAGPAQDRKNKTTELHERCVSRTVELLRRAHDAKQLESYYPARDLQSLPIFQPLLREVAFQQFLVELELPKAK